MPDFRFTELAEQFASTRYPFMDTCSLTADTGQLLDSDMFLDASLHPVGSTSQLHIIQISVAAREVIIKLANSRKVVVATAAFDPLDTNGEIVVTDSYNRPAGLLLADPDTLARFGSWLEGLHNFTAAAATFVPSCVITSPSAGVRGLTVDGNTILTANVVLVGGPGVVLSKVGDTGIRIDVVGDPLYRRRLCDQLGNFVPPRFIQTINGCRPDQYGNINLIIGSQLVDKTILRLNANSTGLVIEANGTLG